MKSITITIAGVFMIGALAMALPIVHAEDVSSTSSTLPTIQNPSPIPPVPMLFGDASSTLPERSTSTQILPLGREMASGTRESVSGTRMMPPKQDQDEDSVVSSDDTPATRLRKLAKYWAVYRELGSTSMYAITTSGTKREIKTLDFFTKIESNFGMRLMPKGSLDQFTTGEAITTVEGLDLSSFRKLAQPCRLIKTADKPVVYLACLGIKRAIQSEKAFRLFGWDFKQVQTVSSQDVDGMKAGEGVSESTVFEQGVQIEMPMNQSEQKVDRSSDVSASKSSISLSGYRVVKVQGSTKMFVITTDGKYHYVPNMQVVRVLKIDLSKAQTITTAQLKEYTEGASLSVENVIQEPATTSAPSAPAIQTGGATGSQASPVTAPVMTTPVMTPPVMPVMSTSTIPSPATSPVNMPVISTPPVTTTSTTI